MIINKTMERSDLESEKAITIIAELNNLVRYLKRVNLRTSSWYGSFELTGNKDSFEVANRGTDYKPLKDAVDDKNFPWFLYWEIVWVVLNSNFKRGQKVLDLGGSSSLFSYYLASRGLEVTTVDLQEELVTNANGVAFHMQWDLDNYLMDMKKLNLTTQFDHITSICVYEHIPMFDRVEINKGIKKLLVPGGYFSITFDYKNPSELAMINTPEDVYEQFVKSSGLRLRGNSSFLDNNKTYLNHPDFNKPYTFGALFQVN